MTIFTQARRLGETLEANFHIVLDHDDHEMLLARFPFTFLSNMDLADAVFGMERACGEKSMTAEWTYTLLDKTHMRFYFSKPADMLVMKIRLEENRGS